MMVFRWSILSIGDCFLVFFFRVVDNPMALPLYMYSRGTDRMILWYNVPPVNLLVAQLHLFNVGIGKSL